MLKLCGIFLLKKALFVADLLRKICYNSYVY